MAIAALAPAAAPAATQQEVAAGVGAGAAWLRTQQNPTTGQITGFGGDYALSALAAAGVHAADVHGPGALDPSAQDYYADLWSAQTTPNSTAILFGAAAGIDVQRLSASTNLVALLATAYNRTGDLEGSFASGATNLAAFSALALARVGAPSAVLGKANAYLRGQQHTDGGWNFGRVATDAQRAGASSVDMTGAVLAALCETGAAATDPDVRGGISFLEGRQDPATGGFGNVDSTGWAVSGIHACGIDPQGGRLTTSASKTPVDFLLSQQDPSGAFLFGGAPNLYSTQNAVRALAGESFSADPPRRAAAADPRFRADAGRRRRDRDAARAGARRRWGRRPALQCDRPCGRVARGFPRRREGRLVAGRLRHLVCDRRRARDRGQRARGGVAAAAEPRAGAGSERVAGDRVRRHGRPPPAGGGRRAAAAAEPRPRRRSGRRWARRPERPRRTARRSRTPRPRHVHREVPAPRDVPRVGSRGLTGEADPRRPRVRRGHPVAAACPPRDPARAVHAAPPERTALGGARRDGAVDRARAAGRPGRRHAPPATAAQRAAAAAAASASAREAWRARTCTTPSRSSAARTGPSRSATMRRRLASRRCASKQRPDARGIERAGVGEIEDDRTAAADRLLETFAERLRRPGDEVSGHRNGEYAADRIDRKLELDVRCPPAQLCLLSGPDTPRVRLNHRHLRTDRPPRRSPRCDHW